MKPVFKIPAMQYPKELGFTFLGGFAIPGRLVSKSNHKPIGHYYLDKKYRDFEGTIALLAKSNLIPIGAKAGWVTIWPGSPNKKYPDLTNLFKGICDGLVKAGIYVDDKDLAGAVLPMAIGKESYLEIWVAPNDHNGPN